MLLEHVSNTGTVSNQVLTLGVVELLNFCHEEAANAFDGRAVESGRAVAAQTEAAAR
jgi:hypothetical protein